jgi:protein-S-isoprenylcysteine O-methyltransferase Ste14
VHVQRSLAQLLGFWGSVQLCCLALFAGVHGARTANLIVRHRVNPIMLRVRGRGVQGLVELSLFVNVTFWAAAIVVNVVAPGVASQAWFLGTPIVQLALARYVGLLLIVVAFILLVLGQMALGQAWRLGIDEEHPGELVTGGIYAISRNPIYLFFDLYFVGTFLLNGTLCFALAALFTVLNLHYQILSEERHLSKLFGVAYDTYCMRTARYWPGWRIWRSWRAAR